MSARDRKTFGRLLFKVTATLAQVRADIDALGMTGDAVLGHGDECDTLACFAGNTTRGTDALLREMATKVAAKGKRRT